MESKKENEIQKLREFLPIEDRFIKFQKLLTELRNSHQEIIKKSTELTESTKPSESAESDITEYYTRTLPAKCEELRALLGESNFVRLYQAIGKNIRLSGKPFDSTITSGKFFTLAERINEVIKIIHKERKAKKQRTFIVVDAIRNPLEAIFFQDRYASFFLMAISAPEPDRQERLRSQNYSEEDISLIDKTEYTQYDPNETEFFSVQDIQACLQRADLYISNPNVTAKVNEFQNLANQLIRVTSLIRKPGIVSPSAIERCMQIAYTAKLNSGCISRQVGAVVTDINFSVRSIGWNDAPHGQVPCNLRSRDDLLSGSDSIAYSSFERTNGKYLGHFIQSSKRFSILKESGRNSAFCFKSEYNAFKDEKNQVHTRSLHAEENAFLQVSKDGVQNPLGGRH